MGRAKKFFKKVATFIEDQFNPVKHGDAGDNTISGNNLAYNKLYGEGGDDTLKAFGTRNDLYGGEGNDYLRATGADNHLYGGEGDDRLRGLGIRNVMYGGEGDDMIQGYGAYNELYGGSGDDHLIGLGAYNKMRGGDGADQMEGIGAYNDMEGGSGSDLMLGLGAYNKMDGDAGNDTLRGIGAYNDMEGGSGDDHLLGLGAYNRMDGGEGNDRIEAIGLANVVDGGSGDDTILGIGGVNILKGGVGEDTITALGGANDVDGQEGRDQIIAIGGVNLLSGGLDDDLIVGVGGVNTVGGGEGDDILIGIGGTNYMEGGEGDDLMIGVGGVNIQSGGDGDDMLFALGAGNEQDGGNGDDILVAMAQGNIQLGGTGDDMMFAAATGNFQYGDDGDDLMVSIGNGNFQFGGDGNDLMFAIGAAALMNVQMGGSGNDIMVAYGNNNVQLGEDGNDLLIGLGGANVQFGGAGNDMLIGYGTANIQHGGSGKDTLIAIGNTNLQIGGSGADILIGTGGANVQFAGNLLSDMPSELEIAGRTFIIPGGKAMELFNKNVTDVAEDTSGNVLIGGGRGNVQIGAAGDDFGLALGEGNLQAFGAGDDIVLAGGKGNLQLGQDGNDIMVSAQYSKKEGGSLQDGGTGNDTMVTIMHAEENSAPVGLQFGGEGNDTMAMVSTNWRYLDFRGVESSSEFGKAVFLDGATVQFGGDGDDVIISAVADFALRSGGDGDDVFFNLLEGGFASGGEGNDLMISGVIPTSVYTGGDGDDTMMDFASYIRLALGMSGTVADAADMLTAMLGDVAGGSVVDAVDEAVGGEFEALDELLSKISDVSDMVNSLDPTNLITKLVSDFTETFVIPTGNSFVGGDGNDTFGIASEMTTAIGGAGNDSYLVSLDAVDDVTIADGAAEIDGEDRINKVTDAAAQALDYIDSVQGGETSAISDAGGRDTVELTGMEVAAENLSFQRAGDNLIVTITKGSTVKTVTFANMTDPKNRAEVLRLGSGVAVALDLAAAFDAGIFDIPVAAEDGADLTDLGYGAVSYDFTTFAPYIDESSTSVLTDDGELNTTDLADGAQKIEDAFDTVSSGVETFITVAKVAADVVLGTEVSETPEDPDATPELTEEQTALTEEGAYAGEEAGSYETASIAVEDLADVAIFSAVGSDTKVSGQVRTLALSDGNMLLLYTVEEDGVVSIRGTLMDPMGGVLMEERIFVDDAVSLNDWDAKALEGNRITILANRDDMTESSFLFASSGTIYDLGTQEDSHIFGEISLTAELTNGNYVYATNSLANSGKTGEFRVIVRTGADDEVASAYLGHGSRYNSQASVVALATGGFVVIWSEDDGYDNDLYFSILDENANIVTDYVAAGLPGGGVNEHYLGEMAALGDGSFLIFYSKEEGEDQLRAARFSKDGTRIGEDFVITEGTVTDISATTLEDGRIAVSYLLEDGTVETTVRSFDLEFGGGDGAEIFEGSIGDDFGQGGAGADALFGSAGDDTLSGNQGNDLLSGGPGDDVLNGGAGSDVLIGGAGDDVMTGGAGNDYFTYASADGVSFGNDVITDFEVGVDVIDLLGLTGVESAADYTVAQVGSDAVISIGDDSITLQNVVAADLGASSVATTGNTIGERGTVELSHEVTTVDLLAEYTDPVVIAFVETNNGTQIVEARVSNVTGTSFDIQLQEADYLDGTHANETVSYMVIEAGRHVLANGAVIEAGTVDTDLVYQNGNMEGMESVSFEGALSGSDTVVLATVNSKNGTDFVTARVDGVDEDGFGLSLAEEEADTSGHTTETVGYVAFQSGDFGDFVTGSALVSNSGTAIGTTADFAQITEINGVDSAVVRQNADNGVLYVQEDQSKDSETGHYADTVSYIDFQTDDGLFLV